MDFEKAIQGKKLLIVDDEPDILETLEELLDMCEIDTAQDYDSGKSLIESGAYDAAILDIMGVRGYGLLAITISKDIPTIMLTAHALTAEGSVKAMKTGADAFVPKDKITDSQYYVADAIRARMENEKQPGRWFSKLKPFFEKKFGTGWLDEQKGFWE